MHFDAQVRALASRAISQTSFGMPEADSCDRKKLCLSRILRSLSDVEATSVGVEGVSASVGEGVGAGVSARVGKGVGAGVDVDFWQIREQSFR